jgi:hypothetical protein
MAGVLSPYILCTRKLCFQSDTRIFIMEEYGCSADGMILLTWLQGVAQDRFSRRRCTCGFIRNREIYWPVGRPSASRGTLPLTSLYTWRYSNKNYIESVLQTDRRLSDAGICKPWVSNPWPIRSYCAARGQICKWCIHLSCCLAYNMPMASSKASSP